MIIKNHFGTSGNNTLTGTYLTADIFHGSLGNDTYVIQDIEDSIEEFVGMGVDTVKSSINYTLGANLENLTLTGSAWLGNGNELNNVITGNLLLDNQLFGLSGNDILTGGDGNDFLSGGDGNDRLTGGVGNDALEGGAGNDILNGGAGRDAMKGGNGNDTYYVDDASETADENYSEGVDKVISTVDYQLGYGIENLTLTENATHGNGNELNNVITGNSLSDSHLNGFAGNDVLTGGAGNDTLIGDEGNDRLTGGSGHDFLNGGNGNDILNGGAGIDQMTGGAGNDSYYVDETSDVVNEMYDGGVDRVISSINYAIGYGIENLTLTGNASQGHGNELDNSISGNSLIASELHGYAGNDILTGGANRDRLHGDEGDDLLKGGAGSDVLYGGAGDDTLNGGTEVDYMLGGTGNDTYYVDALYEMVYEYYNEGIDKVISSVDFTMSGSIENLTLTGNAINGFGNELDNSIVGNLLTNTYLFGYGGDDVLTGGAGNDQLDGGEGDDRLIGGLGNDFLAGGAGDDTLSGGDGDDIIRAGTGIDSLNGGAGNDHLFAEVGDTLTGGLGMDIFGGNLSDSTIRDFQKGTDIISFESYTYSPTHMGTFTFIGQQAFTGMDQLRFEIVGTSCVLYGNTDGDLEPDFQVTLTGVSSIDIGDLQLI